MNVALDMDGVLHDIYPRWISKLIERYGEDYNFPVKEFRMDFGFKKLKEHGYDLDKIYSVIDEKSFWNAEEMEVMEGAIKAVEFLSDRGCNNIYVVTHYFPPHIEGKIGFLKHFKEIPEDNLIFARKKQLIYSAFDIIIDDLAENFPPHKIFGSRCFEFNKNMGHTFMDWEYILEKLKKNPYFL